MPILDIPHDPEQRRVLFQNISTRLKFELKLQDVLTRCSIAVSQNGLRTMSAEQERSLDTLLNLFQAQVTSVGLDYASGLYLFPCKVVAEELTGMRPRSSLCAIVEPPHPDVQSLQVTGGTGSYIIVRPLHSIVPST